MLSAASEAQRIVAAVRAGAVAWVRKDESIDHLLRVIRGVVRGETWLPPTELGGVLRLLIEDQDDRRGCDELLAALTPREREVLFHLVRVPGGKRSRAAAAVGEHGPHPPAEPHGESSGSTPRSRWWR